MGWWAWPGQRTRDLRKRAPIPTHFRAAPAGARRGLGYHRPVLPGPAAPNCVLAEQR
jgi:hypothetical protein